MRLEKHYLWAKLKLFHAQKQSSFCLMSFPKKKERRGAVDESFFFSINTPSGTLCRSPDGSRGETTENDYSK
jgi:hypothetical protein